MVVHRGDCIDYQVDRVIPGEEVKGSLFDTNMGFHSKKNNFISLERGEVLQYVLFCHGEFNFVKDFCLRWVSLLQVFCNFSEVLLSRGNVGNV